LNYGETLKVIILAGGLGTRISEETETKPKPMVEIAGAPILWHIMKLYAMQGFNEFVIATGYKSEVINDYVETISDPWDVKTLDTGIDTQTGGRIKQCIEFINEPTVLCTYGDGLANVRVPDLIDIHRRSKKIATLTAVRPPARFGYVRIESDLVTHFGEKNQADEGWINGGFFVIDKKITEYIKDNLEPFETGALPRLSENGDLGAYKHFGFWKPMDTLREKIELETLASTLNTPPWFGLP
jgi:glucose-1-phosphate cytidylyltransferase